MFIQTIPLPKVGIPFSAITYAVIKMQCIKCHSPRIIKFLDGFGNTRIFCKTCQESIPLKDVIVSQTNVLDFSAQAIPRRWENAGNREIRSLITPR